MSASKILVVDDNEIIIKTISLKLQGAGYQVITAMDGAEAVAAARKENPDLILLDISFPPDVDGVPWDGFRIMAWLHRLEAVKKTPVIIITGGLIYFPADILGPFIEHLQMQAGKLY